MSTAATAPVAAAPASGQSANPATPSARAARPRRVIDAPMRLFHWLFALSFAGAYVTAESEHWRLVHVTLGYTMAGLLGFRLLYGLVGPRPARMDALWRKLAGLPGWLRSLAAGPAAANWRQGQNLLMALAVASLLLLVVPLTLSGYAVYNEWVGGGIGHLLEEAHEALGQGMLAVVLAHLGLIAGLSLLRRRNLAGPMLTGYGEGSGPNLVPRNRGWLAALLLAAVAAFWVAQWQEARMDAGPSAAPQVKQARHR